MQSYFSRIRTSFVKRSAWPSCKHAFSRLRIINISEDFEMMEDIKGINRESRRFGKRSQLNRLSNELHLSQQ